MEGCHWFFKWVESPYITFRLFLCNAKAIYLIYTYMQTTVVAQTASLLFKCNYRFFAAYFSLKNVSSLSHKYFPTWICFSLLSVHTQNVPFYLFFFFPSLFSSGALHALWSSSCLAHFSSSIFYMLLILLSAFLNPPQVLSLWSETT